MTDEEKISALEDALKQPEGKYTHAQISAKLDSLRQRKASVQAAPPEIAARQKATAPQATPKMTVDLGLGPREYDDTNDFVPRVVRGLKRIDEAVTGPITALNKGFDTATAGIYRKGADALANATGFRIGPKPEDYKRLEEEHPIANNMATAAGLVNPSSVASAESRVVGGAVDAIAALAKRRAMSKAGKLVANVATNAAKGAGSNALYSATESRIAGDSPEETARKAKDAAKFGAGFGAGAGALSTAGSEAAAAMRKASPDIQALHEAGLEPGPIPGRPVIRQNQPIRSQLPGFSEPPLVRKATPGTRASAARIAADQIVPDITARSKANNQRFGQLMEQAYAKEGQNPAPFKHIIADIDEKLSNQSLPDPTRRALQDVRSKFEPYIETAVNPELDAMKRALQGASPQQQARLQAMIDSIQGDMPQAKPFTARDLNEIRSYADSKIKTGEIKKGDVQFIQLADLMRNTLDQPGVGPGIARLNAMQSDVMKGFGKRKALLGMNRSQRGEGETVNESVASRISERGEATKTSGKRTGAEGHAVTRAGELGPPPVLPGTTGLPDEVDYKSLLDVPRLQLAQENLQASPSKLFSGAGNSGIGGALTAPFRAVALAGPRAAYPLSRRLGEMKLGVKPIVADDLTRTIRNRGKKKKEREEARP